MDEKPFKMELELGSDKGLESARSLNNYQDFPLVRLV